VKDLTVTKKAASPLRRFLGDEARMMSLNHIAISNTVEADWMTVLLPASAALPEEQGKLFLFPVDENRFCLELCYLRFEETEAETGTAYIVRFLPAFFDQYPVEALMANQPFRFDQITEQQFPICNLTCSLLDQLRENSDLPPLLSSLQQSQTAIQLLRRALECITVPFTVCQVPACRFLAFESERDKIKEACRIIEKELDQSYTIRELSRKVAINECYLKKGFKALTGSTVHEYRENLRIARAKELLQQQGQTVTDVALTLGFSSISHFSTAFKRVTGLKPCELLA
jgi:AraC-like DNA-binding protein